MMSRTLPFAGLHSHTIIYISAKGSRPTDDNIDDEFNGAYKALYRVMWSQNPIDRPIANKVISMVDTLIA